MIKLDIFTMAMKNLARRKGRTFLTMLGVLIGTTSIVVMVSLGLGMQASYQAMFEQWGSLNQIDVSAGGYYGEEQKNPVVLNDETVAVFKAMEGVSAVTPVIQVSGDSTYGKKTGYLQIRGVDASSMELMGFTAAAGRLLEETDHNVLLLGYQVSDQFYDPKDTKHWENYEYDPEKVYQETLGMVNKRLTVNFMNHETQKTKKLNMEVVGVLSKETAGGSWYAYAPLDDMQKIQKMMQTKEEKKSKNKNIYSTITVFTDDVSVTKALCEQFTELGYNAYSIATQLEGIESQTKIIQAVLGGIGSITLLVAAIGIINTMIMSIYERTKEIAIMKVIGATFSDIRLLFLTEAGLIGLFGGVLGLLLSFGLSFVINQLSGDFMGTGTEVGISQIPWWLAVFAMIFSMLIGVLAGVYPANRAVKLSPIEAMRSN